MKKILLRVVFLLSICGIILYSLLRLPPGSDRKPEFSKAPQRIVSLGPALTEGLYLLGVEDRIVGVTVYCRRPPDVQKKEKIGTVTKIDIEKVVSLKPDLVLATSLSDSKQIEKLRALGIEVIEFSYIKSFSQICEQFLELGRIVGRSERAEEIIEIAEDKIDSIKKRVEGLQRPRVFVQIGARPLYTVTRDSFINDYIDLAGGTNIASGATSGLYSREEVLNQDPDVIIIATMGIVGEEEKKLWQRYKTLKAVRNDRIYIVDADKLCSPTPMSFVKMLEEITEIFHHKLTESKV